MIAVSRVVAYVGPAHTPAEPGVVMARARQLLAEYERPGQDVLDLGVDVEPAVTLIGAEAGDGGLDLDLPALGPAAAAVPVLAEPGRVLATASRLLFELLADGHNPARKPRFVKAATSGLTLDEAALARARRLVGLKGYVTNIPAHLMPAPEVITSYHDLWNVEASFRMSKTDLAARSMFARRRDATEAHLTIVFSALALSPTIQQSSGLALRRVPRTLRSATIAINGAVQTLPPELDADQRALITAILRGLFTERFLVPWPGRRHRPSYLQRWGYHTIHRARKRAGA